MIQNSTNHIATLPPENIGYIEIPVKKEKLKYYQVHGINCLVHNVAQTFHPEITGTKPQTNFAVHRRGRLHSTIFITPS